MEVSVYSALIGLCRDGGMGENREESTLAS